MPLGTRWSHSTEKPKTPQKMHDERIQFLVKNSHVWNATSNASCHAQSVGCTSYGWWRNFASLTSDIHRYTKRFTTQRECLDPPCRCGFVRVRGRCLGAVGCFPFFRLLLFGCLFFFLSFFSLFSFFFSFSFCNHFVVVNGHPKK